MPLLGLLEAIIVLGILFAILMAIVKAVPIGEPWRTIALLVIALIAVVVVFNWLEASNIFSVRLPRV